MASKHITLSMAAATVFLGIASVAPPSNAALPVRLAGIENCAARFQVGCPPLVLAQARGPRIGAGPIIRRSITDFVRSTLRMVGISVRRIGVSARSTTAGLRHGLQRRLVTSVCCRQQVHSNLVADDLASRFPGARIEPKVRAHRSTAPARDRERRPEVEFDLDLIDFLIQDRDRQRLVLESCVDHAYPGVEQTEQPIIYHTASGEMVHVSLDRAEIVRACVDFETGEITYTVVTPGPDG